MGIQKPLLFAINCNWIICLVHNVHLLEHDQRQERINKVGIQIVNNGDDLIVSLVSRVDNENIKSHSSAF